MSNTTVMSLLKIPLLILAFTPLVFYSTSLFPFVFPKVMFIRTALGVFWVGLAIYLIIDLYKSWRNNNKENLKNSNLNPKNSEQVDEGNKELLQEPAKTLTRPFRAFQFLAGESVNLSSREGYIDLLKSAFVRVWKNQIFLVVAVFMLLATVSTMLAVNPYRAFWGDVERGEGLIAFLFLFGFFVATLLVFNARDWGRFFGLTLIVAGVLFADQLFFFLTQQSLFMQMDPSGAVQPFGSLLGNPTFLSAFYLFAIFAAAMLLAPRLLINANKKLTLVDKLRQAGLVAIIFVSIAGIFIGGTRGAIVGLALGAVAVAIFVILRKEFPLIVRRVALIGMATMVLFGIVFVMTRNAPLWQGVPGLDRVAMISLDDPTTKTRIIAAGIGLDAVNPANEGIIRTMFGWGPENFRIAYQEHFDPTYFRYEALWFDRAHNKLIDVLVMNGALGLVAYLAIWWLIFKFIMRPSAGRARNRDDHIELGVSHDHGHHDQRVERSYQGAALLFFAVAYFTQNLFVFDMPVSYISFFAFLSFIASRGGAHKEIETGENERVATDDSRKTISALSLPVFAGAMAIFSVAVLMMTFIAFGQMRAYIVPLVTGRADLLVGNFERITQPYTYIQPTLRFLFVENVLTNIRRANMDVEAIRPFLVWLEEMIGYAADREQTDARMFMLTASVNEVLGTNDIARKYHQKALELAPRRQDVLYRLAMFEARMGYTERALGYARRIMELDPQAMIGRIYYADVLMRARGKDAFDEATELIFSVFEGPRAFRAVRDEIAVVSGIFETHLFALYLERDAVGYLDTLQRWAKFEEQKDAAVRFYSPQAPASERLIEINRRIEAFIAEGWEAVRY